MKIDVEGHEPRVLEEPQLFFSIGASDLFRANFNEHWFAKAGYNLAQLQQLITTGGLVEMTPASAHRNLENRFFSLVP